MKVKIVVKSSSGGDMGTYEGSGSDEVHGVIEALVCGDDGQAVSLLDGDTITVEEVE